MKTLFTPFTTSLNYYKVFYFAVFIFCINNVSGQSSKWKLCEFQQVEQPRFVEIEFNSTILFGNVKELKIRIKIVDISCYGAKDGSMEIVSIIEGNSARNLDEFTFYLTGNHSITDIGFKTKVENLGVGPYSFTFGSEFYEGVSFPFEIEGETFSPRLSIDVEKVINETCPGTMDGEVSMVVDAAFIPDVELYWGSELLVPEFTISGVSYYRKSGLSKGKYILRLESPFLNHKCCLEKEVIVKTNACPEFIFDFTGEFQYDWFIQPGDAAESVNNMAIFIKDGCIYIPFDIDELPDALIFVGIDYSGRGSIELLDALTMNSLAKKDIIGVGADGLILRDFTTNEFYVKIQFDEGSYFQSLTVDTYDDPDDILFDFFASQSQDSKRKVINGQACVGDTIFPYDGFGLTGGISPYSANWALEDDLIFNDADSLLVPISFTKEGMYSFALEVEDLIGGADTIFFNYDVFLPESFSMIVPELNLNSKGDNTITICDDYPAFTIITNSVDAVLSSNTNGLVGATFDPSQAGAGLHYVLSSGESCDSSSYLIINVIERKNIELTGATSFMDCNDDVNLSSYLNNDVFGLWQLDNVDLEDTILNIASLPTGSYTLQFLTGGGECIDSSSLTIDIIPGPSAILNTIPDTFTNLAAPIDLNEFLDNSSTFGGTWSGGNYIDGGTFNPAGLTPGDYTITYTVGEGPCQISIQSILTIHMSTSVDYILNEINVNIAPNPLTSNFKYCIEGENVLNDLIIDIIDLNGRVIMSQTVNRDCDYIEMSNLESGLYLFNLKSNNRIMYVERIVKL